MLDFVASPEQMGHRLSVYHLGTKSILLKTENSVKGNAQLRKLHND